MKLYINSWGKIRCAFLTGSLILLMGISANGQDLTSSPYSRFGIGDIFSRNFGRSQAMGGLGIGLRSDRDLNFINPASLSAMDSLTFLFEVGIMDKVTFLQTESLKSLNNNIGFSYLGMGFPITKWWSSSIGILPLSGVKYAFADTEFNPQIGDIDSNFSGDGGVSQLIISNSFHPFKYISLGASLSYLFGPLNHYKSLAFPADSMFFSTHARSSAIIGDLHLSYGIQADIPLRNDYFLTLGGIFENKTNLKTESSKLVFNTGQGVIDTLLYSINKENSVILPTSMGGGFTFGKKNKFTLGLDYKKQNWEEAEFLGQKDSLGNSSDLIFGVEYIPDAFSPIRYSKRIRYRAGIHYSKSYIQLRGSQLQEVGINFGVGLPVSMDRLPRKHTINLSAEIGKRGTIKNDLISEVYGLFTIQLNLHDIWFYKPKYD
jgi:hypothetical protein